MSDVGIQVAFYAEDCLRCRRTFAMTREAVRDLRRSHEVFYCPYCRHQMHYGGESDVERAKRQQAQVERRAAQMEQQRNRWMDEAQRERRRRAAAKGQLTKVKNRVAKGVCPCCNRTFQNLGRHMANQHPDYAGGEA